MDGKRLVGSADSGAGSDYVVINVTDILISMWQHKFFIIALVVLGVVLMFVKVRFLTVDTYTADGVLYVSSESNQEELQSISSSVITSSRNLSMTAIETIKTRSFLTEVSKSIGGKYTWRQIKSMLSVSAVNDTELISVSVTATDPEDAYNIAASILSKAPQKLTSVFKAGEFSVVDEAVAPRGSNGKGLTKKMMLGGFVGALIAAVIVFFMNFFDTKVHKAEDVAKRYGVSILGEIAQ